MISNANSSEDAIQIFLKRVLLDVYDNSIKSIINLLVNGPSGRAKQPLEENLHNWYQALDEKEKEQIEKIIEKSIRSTIFSFLVMLDNKSGGRPFRDKISDFALFIQFYQDEESLYNYKPQNSLRVNLSYTIDGELHDQFLDLLNENS